jgi:hypothetical protein
VSEEVLCQLPSHALPIRPAGVGRPNAVPESLPEKTAGRFRAGIGTLTQLEDAAEKAQYRRRITALDCASWRSCN